MGAAAIITLYLAKRFLIQPALEWYRGTPTPLTKV